MSRPLVRDTPMRRIASNSARIGNEERKPNLPGFWVCVGDYQGGTMNDPSCATTSSPPYENGWTYVGSPYDYPAFRHGLDGGLEFRGVLDSSGASTGTVAFTLPTEWRPANDMARVIPIVDVAPQTATLFVDATTGEVTIEF